MGVLSGQRRVDLLEFARNKECCQSEELKLLKRQSLPAEVSVHNVDCYEKRFRKKPQIGLQADEPLYQTLPVVGGYLRLKRWRIIVGKWQELVLSLEHPIVDFVSVLQIVVMGQEPASVVTLVADHILRGLCLDVLGIELSQLPSCGVLMLWLGLGKSSLILGGEVSMLQCVLFKFLVCQCL